VRQYSGTPGRRRVCPDISGRSRTAQIRPTYPSQFKKVKHRCHPRLRRHLDLFEVFCVLDHHIVKIFGVPKCFQNRFSFRIPVLIGRCAKLVLGSGLNDLDVLEVWRIGFTVDLFDQPKRCINRILKIKNFIRAMVKTVDAILFPLLLG
jgi:hypothetical protein